MGRADIDAPTLEAEERLVEQNEAEIMPQKPELPATLDAALNTFIEKLNLEQPGPAEFVLGSALAATAERFGPSEAEILLSRFDEDLTAEFFENLIDSGEIPQSPTMNNLLAGDVNSQAAQFILENLATQSASGAFITMQANRRDTSSEEERKKERKGTLSEAAAFAQMQAIAADLNILEQQIITTMEALQELFVEIEAAELAFDTTKAQMQAEEQALDENISENNTITQELHAAGFATITLGDILDHTPVEQLPENFAALMNSIEDEEVKAALAERAFIVERDADGSLFVELGRGEKLELTEAMKADIQAVIVVAHATRVGPDTPSFRTDTEAGGKPLEAYHANHSELINGMESYANAEDAHNVARENYKNLQAQARDIITEIDGYRAQTEAYDDRIAMMEAAGQDVTALQAQQETIYNQITEASIKLGTLQNRMADKLNGATSSTLEQELVSTTPIGLDTSLNTSLLDTGLSLSPSLSSSSLLAPRFSDLDFSTIDLTTLDYSTLDFTTTDFSTLNFNSLTSDFASNDSLSLGLGSTSSLMPSYLAYDMSYNFYDYDFFDLDLDTIDFSTIDFDDSFFADTQALLAEIDTGAIQSELDSLNADIDEIVNSVIAEEELPEGIDRAALEEAIRKDLEWSAENKACRPVEQTNVGKLLAAEGAEAFMTQMSQPGMTVMGMPLGGIFNGAAAMSEHTALAQSLSMAVDQAGADGRGERLVEAQKRLQEIEGGEQNTDAVADAAAESLTLEAPSVEEMTREAKLANEARVYADQVRANGVVTERDLEDAFPGLSAEEMDLVKAEMDAEGIEVRLEEPVNDVEAPAPTVSEPSASVTNTRSPYEPAAMTPGV